MTQENGQIAIAEENIISKIYYVRGKQVMLSHDLAELYQVETKVLNQQVKRNIGKFPERYMFQLIQDEHDRLRSQNVTIKRGQYPINPKPKFNFLTQTFRRMSDKSMLDNDQLIQRIREILENARHKVYRTANTEMLRAYWNVGREIVEEEQEGQDRAKYGSALLEELAKRLTELYGKSFSSRHLRYMRQFYREFPKWNAVRSELSWTHYRLLLKVEKEDARVFYMKEAITGNWSTRQLERQINSLYFYRLQLEKTNKETPPGQFRWTIPTPELFDHPAKLNGPLIARIN